MAGKQKKMLGFHQIELTSFGINRTSQENHRMICGKKDKNPNQPVNSVHCCPPPVYVWAAY